MKWDNFTVYEKEKSHNVLRADGFSSTDGGDSFSMKSQGKIPSHAPAKSDDNGWTLVQRKWH